MLVLGCPVSFSDLRKADGALCKLRGAHEAEIAALSAQLQRQQEVCLCWFCVVVCVLLVVSLMHRRVWTKYRIVFAVVCMPISALSLHFVCSVRATVQQNTLNSLVKLVGFGRTFRPNMYRFRINRIPLVQCRRLQPHVSLLKSSPLYIGWPQRYHSDYPRTTASFATALPAMPAARGLPPSAAAHGSDDQPTEMESGIFLHHGLICSCGDPHLLFICAQNPKPAQVPTSPVLKTIQA